FFFSSRIRHTRSKRDWSSDVCSSDLYTNAELSQHHPVGCTCRLTELRVGILINQRYIIIAAFISNLLAGAGACIGCEEDDFCRPAPDRLYRLFLTRRQSACPFCNPKQIEYLIHHLLGMSSL